MSERLTLIVPAYKVAKYLPACLQSIAEQPDSDFSVIVVDDGSPDNSGAIADAFAAKDTRFSVLHQANAGVSVARNAGLSKATGEWVWFVDGDDLIAPSAISTLLAALDGHAAFDMLCFGYRSYPCRLEPIAPCSLRRLTVEGIRALRLRNVFAREDLPCADVATNSASFCLYRRAFLTEHGLRFQQDIHFGQDSLFHLQALFCVERICVLNAPLYLYRRNEGSISIRYSPNIVALKLALVAAYTQLLEPYRRQEPCLDELLRCRVISTARQCLSLGLCHHDNPDPYAVRKAAFITMMDTPVVQTAYQDLRILHTKGLQLALYRCIQKRRFAVLNLLYRLYTKYR